MLDFGENYTCVSQDEAQLAHWSHSIVTVHPVVTYYRCPKDNEVIKEDVVYNILSSDIKHDVAAVLSFQLVVNDHLVKKRQLRIEHQVQFTDGCAAQYKSSSCFQDISAAEDAQGFSITRNFFGPRHGKGPNDGVTGVVKIAVRNAVKSRSAVVRDAQEMYEYCREKLTKDDMSWCQSDVST